MDPCICCRRPTTCVVEGRRFCARCQDAWKGAGGTYESLMDELQRVFAPLVSSPEARI